MYSEGRLTRSKARSQGIDNLQELPLTSTKGRTTSKKPGRAAFLDVTNEADKSLQNEDSTDSAKNLSAFFEPTEISTGLSASATPETLAVVPEAATELAESKDVSSTESSSSITEETTAIMETQAEASAENISVQPTAHDAELPVSKNGQESQDIEEAIDFDELSVPVAAEQFPHLEEQLDYTVSAVTHNTTASTSTPQAAAEGLEVNAEDQPSAFDHKDQGDLFTSSHTVGSPAAGVPQHDGGASDLSTRSALKSTAAEEEEMDEIESLPPASPCGDMLSPASGAPSAVPDIALTPEARTQAVISGQTAETPSAPEVPATVVAKLPDAGHIIAEGFTPTPAKSTQKSTPTAAAAMLPALSQTALDFDVANADTTVGAGVLDSVYYSDSDKGSPALHVSAMLSAARGNAATGLQEELSFSVVEPVYYSESDSPAKQLPDVKYSDELAATAEPASFAKPASGTLSTPPHSLAKLTGDAAADLTEPAASAMFTTSAGVPDLTDYMSQSESESASPAPSVPPHAKGHGLPEHVESSEGGDDRWEMDVEAPIAPAANVYAASRLESKIHASPSYDPRSLRQLRKEVATKLTKTAAVKAPAVPTCVPAGLYESQSDIDMSPGPLNKSHEDDVEENEDLCSALNALEIQSTSNSKEPLRGLPVPQGMHIRFDEDGQAMHSPNAGQIRLRGVPAPCNSHIRFD